MFSPVTLFGSLEFIEDSGIDCECQCVCDVNKRQRVMT